MYAKFAFGPVMAPFACSVEGAADVYVLHAFHKKSQRTSALDLSKGKARYKLIP